MKKTTIYIDAEDDIASIVEKVSDSPEKIVALVLPKRPSMLQSSVNVQLLKRAGDESTKNIGLITNDEQVIRLAGQNSVHVASSLQSKPSIPMISPVVDGDIDEISDSGNDDNDVDPAQPDVYADDKIIDPKTPIEDLVGDKDEPIELDNTDENVSNDEKPAKKAEPKLLTVPNFGKFRTRLILGGLALVLIVSSLIWAFVIAPRASITPTTQKSELSTKVTLTAGVAYATSDTAQNLVPAVRKEDEQKLTGTFKATGQKDVGEKARGTITFRNCESTDPLTIPSGTGVSKGSYTFITQAAITLESGNFSGGGSVCTTPSSEEIDVQVVASESGDDYNLAPGNYSVAGYSGVRASGDAMSGGTSKVATVVTDSDVEIAKQAVLASGADNVKGKLAQLLKDENLVAIEETYVSEQGTPSSSIAIGSEASSDVTLTIEVTSSMLGIKTADIDPFLTTEIIKQIDQSKQKIYNTGSLSSTIAVIEKPNKDTAKFTPAASASIGPVLDQASVSSQVAGMKAGEAKQLLESQPGVTRADISLSPFWVFSIPKKSSKISVTVNE